MVIVNGVEMTAKVEAATQAEIDAAKAAGDLGVANAAAADAKAVMAQDTADGKLSVVPPSSDLVIGGFKHTFVGGVLNLITVP